LVKSKDFWLVNVLENAGFERLFDNLVFQTKSAYLTFSMNAAKEIEGQLGSTSNLVNAINQAKDYLDLDEWLEENGIKLSVARKNEWGGKKQLLDFLKNMIIYKDGGLLVIEFKYLFGDIDKIIISGNETLAKIDSIYYRSERSNEDRLTIYTKRITEQINDEETGKYLTKVAGMNGFTVKIKNADSQDHEEVARETLARIVDDLNDSYSVIARFFSKMINEDQFSEPFDKVMTLIFSSGKALGTIDFSSGNA
ncbi:unnamed protein product, partial [marine sediment metagenome]